MVCSSGSEITGCSSFRISVRVTWSTRGNIPIGEVLSDRGLEGVPDVGWCDSTGKAVAGKGSRGISGMGLCVSGWRGPSSGGSRVVLDERLFGISLVDRELGTRFIFTVDSGRGSVAFLLQLGMY